MSCSASRSALLSAAFINPDGKVSVLVMNPTENQVTYCLWLARNAAEVSSMPHSIQTLVF
jgi:glucosylceramidase